MTWIVIMDAGTPGARELGEDFPSRLAAEKAAAAFNRHWPRHYYAARPKKESDR